MTPNLRTIGAIPLQMLGDGVPPQSSRCAARCTCRSRGFRASNERLVAEGKADLAESRATPPPARCGRRTPAITAARPLSIWVYGTGHREGLEHLETHWETLAVAARARLPHEPVRRAGRVDRGGRRRLPRVGAPAHRARLRDRRHRDQGRLVRPAAPARRAARAAALGARVQVGADDGGDAPERDPRSASGAPARSTRGRCSSRSRSAASRSRARRCTTRRTSTARTSARATT